ncbi:MAG: TlpA family protein disulfide reductase [Planctomycetes bacterium]|nr:TlpA family protein disulfide reductase [Planctomycetota bacterium]
MNRGVSRAPGRFWVFVLLVAVTGVRERAAVAGPRQDFAKLEAEMEDAANEYRSAVAAARAAGGEPAPAPVDRRKEILQKMDALAASVLGTADGAFIAGQSYLWALGVEYGSMLARFERLVEQYPDDPVFDDILDDLPEQFYKTGTYDAWIRVLDRLVGATGRLRTKSAAAFAAGRIHLAVEKLPLAKSAFERVINVATAEAREGSASDGLNPAPAKPEKGKPLAPDAPADFAEMARGYIFEIEHLQVGMPAPDFAAKTLDGREVSLKSLRGKVVLLDFWASWCVPCLQEIPHLQAAAAHFAGQPFEILGIGMDNDRQALENVLRSHKVPGTHTWDPRGGENPIGKLYNVRGYPTWFLLDDKGVIRKRTLKGPQLIAAVEELLPKPAPAAGSERTNP